MSNVRWGGYSRAEGNFKENSLRTLVNLQSYEEFGRASGGSALLQVFGIKEEDIIFPLEKLLRLFALLSLFTHTGISQKKF